MSNSFPYSSFSKSEEFWNIFIHKIGIGFSIIAIIMIAHKVLEEALYVKIILIVYGLTLFSIFLCSVLTHKAIEPNKRSFFNLLDYIAIDVYILGTYIPILGLQLKNAKIFLLIIGLLSLIGIVSKMIYRGRAINFSILNYIFMSTVWLWTYPIFIKEIPSFNLQLLCFGYLSFLVGFLLFKFDNLKYNHSLHHTFVLFGAILHFWEIWSFNYS